MSGRHDLVRFRWASSAALGLLSLLGLVAFGWPFVLEAGSGGEALSHGADAPWLFVLLLPLLVLVVLAQVAAGGLDAKAVALLGMLAAVGGALRALSPGAAGLEPSFAVIMLGGRVFGRGFGFVLGCLSMLVGALITGGVGPWLPFQMVAAGWVGLLSGCLPGRARGRTEVLLLAALGAVLGFAFGALMNLWSWPFVDYGDGISFEAGAGLATNLASYARYYLVTSLAWDTGRAVTTVLLLLVAGRPLLRALRRTARLAALDARPVFAAPLAAEDRGPVAVGER